MGIIRIFRTPRDIVWGRGSMAHLENIRGKKALIVTDPVMTKLGMATRARDYLERGGLEVRIFDQVEPEPSIQTVLKIVADHRDFNPDIIVGLGGGSVIDASKAFRVFFEHPQLTFEDVHALNGPPKVPIPPFKKTIHVAIPSTSGTGSEVTGVSIVTDPSMHAKCPITSPDLKPDIAIVDPDIADSMPNEVLADTGLDALTHAIESYVSALSNDFSRGPSLEAIRLLMNYLPPAFLKNDPVAKEHIHYGATIAGIAFSNSSVGICHTIATKVGGVFKLTHGRGNAIALPYVIQYNSKAVGDLFVSVSKAIGYREEDLPGALDYLIQRICQVQKQLKMPGSYKESGIDESAYKGKVKEFAQTSGAYPASLYNPRKPTMEEIESMYYACYYGDFSLIK